jgi:hypothetical protein
MPLTEEYPPNEDMRIISILAILIDVGEGKNIELLLSTTTVPVDRKQDRESQATTDKTYNRQHLEESQVQISIERLAVKNIFVWNAFEAPKPAELRVGKLF